MNEHRIIRQATESILRAPAVARLRSALADVASPPLYLVGGALRDVSLELETKDFDFVVPGDAGGIAKRIGEALGARYVMLHEDWGVARLVWSPPGEEEGPISLDFAPLRGTTIHEDLWQRDFTCNAMAMRISQDEAVATSAWEDPTGGMRDLRARRIRMVHPAALREDPLRLIRAFRLACTLDLQIERFTLQAVHAARGGLRAVAPERVRQELFKTLGCPQSLGSILRMDETGLLATVLPELEGLKGLRQGKFHHLDAWNHTVEAYRILEQACRKGFEQLAPWDRDLKAWMEAQEDVLPLLKVAILFHDIGKAATQTVDAEGEPHFYGHAAKGADIASATMRRLHASRHEEEQVKKWVRYHMGPVHMMRSMERDHLRERAKIRFLRKLGHDAPGMLLLSVADFLATGGPFATGDRRRLFLGLLDSLLELYFQRDAASVAGKSLVTGKDLMDALEISPGPVVGRLLRLLEEARVEGKIGNWGEAIQLARCLLEGMQ